MAYTMFVSTRHTGVTCAERNGDAWATRDALASEDVRCLAVAGRTILAGTQGNGVLTSSDRGQTWTRSGLDGAIVKAIAAAPSDPQIVYAGTKPPAVYVSIDTGWTWTELTAFRRARRWWWRQPAERPTTPYVQALAVSPTNPRVVIAGMEAGAVLRTTDGGITWSGHLPSACRDCHALAFHAHQDWVYEGGGGALHSKPGVAISRDAGEHWERPDAGLDRKYGWAVASDPGDPMICYVALSPGAMRAHSSGRAHAYIFRTTDAATWHKLDGGLPQPIGYMPYALLTHPSEPGHVWAGLANGDIWHSPDHGDSWARLPVDMKAIERSLVGL